MTLILPAFDNIAAGVRIALTGDDELYVAPTVTIGATDSSYAVNATGPSAKITVLGTVYSANYVAIGLNVTTPAASVTIADTGVLKGFYGIFSASSEAIKNDGTIIATSSGVLVNYADGVTHSIVNNGLIAAANVGIGWNSVNFAGTATTTIVNTGTIKANIAINLPTGWAGFSADVTNHGLLDGAVNLMGGADILDNFGGTITGAVNMWAGDDTMVAAASSETVDGGDGSDLLNFGQLGGVRLFLDGLTANGGSALGDVFTNFERVIGSALGNDTVTGTAAANSFNGQNGNDKLIGLDGIDTLIGGGGNDTLDGGLGNDVMKGGAGDDVYFVDSLLDQITEALNNGIDLAKTTVDLTLATNVDNAQVVGVAGLTLVGNGLVNVLTGASGADHLNGKAGVDVLKGGGGDDVFLFSKAAEAGDAISDFAHGHDQIALQASTFGGGLVAGEPIGAGAFLTRADNLAQQADDRFIFRTTDKTLWFDANGNAAGGLTLIADLQANAVVTAGDIVIL